MYIYGRQEDIRRLVDALRKGGQHLAKLNKMPEGSLTSLKDAEVCDIDAELFSTITARYYKGIAGHKDNMVIEVIRLED